MNEVKKGIGDMNFMNTKEFCAHLISLDVLNFNFVERRF